MNVRRGWRTLVDRLKPRRGAPRNTAYTTPPSPHVRRSSLRVYRCALSLVELLAIVALIGVLATIVIVRVASVSAEARARACNAQRGNIEIQIQLHYRNEGTWPTANLSDIGGDPDYFPEGLPTCPVDGSAYTMDGATHHVTGHDH